MLWQQNALIFISQVANKNTLHMIKWIHNTSLVRHCSLKLHSDYAIILTLVNVLVLIFKFTVDRTSELSRTG